MTIHVARAVQILANARWAAIEDQTYCKDLSDWVCDFLNDSIRHLAYPDRDIYPKTRKGTKGAPIVRRQFTDDDVR